uniref:Uncharacterized protein n=1 Tax=Glossina pallidipes TaxID=7398 RepID=A0A1A9ZCP9_GLOPL
MDSWIYPLMAKSSWKLLDSYRAAYLMYLVGSNNRETRFRVLIIDRTLEPEDGSRLHIVEDPNEYNAFRNTLTLEHFGFAKSYFDLWGFGFCTISGGLLFPPIFNKF